MKSLIKGQKRMKSPFNCKPGTGVPLPKTMTCPLCKTCHKVRGYYRHLKACLPRQHMDFANYERQYPLVSYSPWHAFAIQWRRLANFSVTRYGLGDYHGCYWFHINAAVYHDGYYAVLPAKNGQPQRRFRRPETRPLLAYQDRQLNLRKSFYQFGKHLRCDLPLAIWPDLDNRFLMIDLDGRQTKNLAVLLERLKARGLAYHLEFSGSKGYHVWVFFRGVVPNESLITLYNELCDGLETDRNVWPFRNGLIKLPLGLHPKTRNVAGFLKTPTIPIPLAQQLDYFLAIRPIDFPKDISVQCKTPSAPTGQKPETRGSRPRKKSANTRPEWQITDEECAELVHNNTRPAELSRYFLLVRLTVFLIEIEHRSELECIDILFRWSKCVSKTSVRTLAYDVKRQVRSVFALRMCRSCGPLPELTLTRLDWIHAHIEQVLTAHVGAGHRLDRNQLPQARNALCRLAEYLVQLVLWRKGRAYAGFGGISARTGLSIKRISKWLPLLCGDVEQDHEIKGRRPYRGNLLIRVGFASDKQGLAQEFILSPQAAAALSMVRAA